MNYFNPQANPQDTPQDDAQQRADEKAAADKKTADAKTVADKVAADKKAAKEALTPEDARTKAEEAVVKQHGEEVRKNPGFDALVQEELNKNKS